MLGIFLNNAPDGIDKSFELIQASAKEGIKFLLSDRDVGLIFHLPIVLLSAKQGVIYEKRDGKWHIILTFGPGSGKRILTLQKEVIAI